MNTYYTQTKGHEANMRIPTQEIEPLNVILRPVNSTKNDLFLNKNINEEVM